MHDGKIQQPEGMRAAPPAGGVRGVAAVARPGVTLVFLQTVKAADVLGVADPLEDAHVLARRKDIRARDFRIDAVDAPRHILALVEVAVRKFLRQRREKVAEDERLVGHGRELARLNFGGIDDLEMAADERLCALLRSLLVVKEVEGVKVLVVRVDAVAGEPAAQTVGTVVHDGDRLDSSVSALILA